MKIFYAVHHFPPKYNGGAEWRTHRTATAMQIKGHEVSVVCIEKVVFGKPTKVEVQSENFGNLRVYRLDIHLDIRPDRLGYLYENTVLGDTISDLLDVVRADIFHVFGGYLLTVNALQAARRKGIPTIVSLTDFWYLCPRIQMIRSDNSLSTFPIESWRCVRCLGEEKRRYRWLRRVFPSFLDFYWRHRSQPIHDIRNRMNVLVDELNLAGKIISPSNFVKDAYIQGGVDPDKIVYFRQGVDLPNVPQFVPMKQPSTKLRIGYIGQITQIKGVDVLIKAVNQLADLPIHLDIYGDLTKGPRYVKGLRAIVSDHHQIEFKGLFDRKELISVMGGLDVIVVPSLWYENSPNVIQEAFATKTPVITSDLGGMAELIEHRKNGLLFRAGDDDALAEQLRALLNEHGLLSQLQNGIGQVKSVEVEIAELEEIYHYIKRKADADAHRY